MFQNKKNIAERIKGVKSVSKTKFIVILILSIIGAALIGGGIWVARFVRRVENPWPSQAPKTFDVKTQDPMLRTIRMSHRVLRLHPRATVKT